MWAMRGLKCNARELVELQARENFVGCLEAQYPTRAAVESSLDGQVFGVAGRQVLDIGEARATANPRQPAGVALAKGAAPLGSQGAPGHDPPVHGRPGGSRPAPAGTASRVCGTWCIINNQAYSARLREPLGSNAAPQILLPMVLMPHQAFILSLALFSSTAFAQYEVGHAPRGQHLSISLTLPAGVAGPVKLAPRGAAWGLKPQVSNVQCGEHPEPQDQEGYWVAPAGCPRVTWHVLPDVIPAEWADASEK